MARIILKGNVADVELVTDSEDGQVIAKCVTHDFGAGGVKAGECPWSERYDCMDDATEYAADHADTGRQS